MKKLTIKTVTTSIVMASILFLSFGFVKEETIENRVMIYGIVYNSACGTETVQTYYTKLVDASDVNEAYKQMKEYLEIGWPNAKRIQVGSSKFDYGTDASNMSILKWKAGNSNCEYTVYVVAFGTTEGEALNNAIRTKNSAAGESVSYEMVEQKYW